MSIKVFSFGGGVQSTASLVLAAQGKIDYKTFLFANVGDDSEHPATLTYVHEVAMPYAKEHGLELIELRRIWQKGERAGQVATLYGELTKSNSRTAGGIPIYMGEKSVPGNRLCTITFKIKVVDRWLKEYGAKDQGAKVGIGISMDEWHRMRKGVDPETPWKELVYPLIDLRMNRQDCMKVIDDAGLPIPPKSACWFCPYHTLKDWQNMRNKEPELFQKVCDLEELMHKRADGLGVDIWFSKARKPLAMATTGFVQENLFDNDQACDSGYCFL